MSNYKSIFVAIIYALFLFTGQAVDAYNPFWDFRHWDSPNQPIYKDYMKEFTKHGITALILINKETSPPFERVQRFLKDANKDGINVWVRTNRVTPKRGIPGMPNGTLDFALNKDIQGQVLEYLDQLAALSQKYPNMKGLIIGGEELIGAHINNAELSRWDNTFFLENGFHMTGKLTDSEKLVYFDWIQEKNNLWYAKMYDYIHKRYPSLDLFIYPSTAALGESRYSAHPRPAYWDIYDLIVKKQKKYNIIAESYNINHKYEAFLTGSESAYLRDATNKTVQIFIIHQSHIARGQSYAPKISQIYGHIFASLVNGANGVGFWATDFNTGKDIYYTNRERWELLFDAIEKGRTFSKFEKIIPNIYILKPRYSKYFNDVNETSLDAFAELYRKGFFVGFVTGEQAKNGILPQNAKIYYVPAAYKYEQPEALKNIEASGKKIIYNNKFDLFNKEVSLLVEPMFNNAPSEKDVNVIISPHAVLLPNSLEKVVTIHIRFSNRNIYKPFSEADVKVKMAPDSVIVLDATNIDSFR